ncbi:stabilin-2 isoform X1 [Anguilla anguilla]|uniref:stabilin-2 isoform X1 n=1 Tax=Anguilla anguilla TaxID=7936 RepID=UPI0015AE388A|nr:stabilin-2 isoform X1 [Anguilla anguilla]
MPVRGHGPIMDRRTRLYPGTLTLLAVLIALGLEPCSAAPPAKNRCDKVVTVTTQTRCHSCLISALVDCPKGFKKRRPGIGQPGCKYTVSTAKNMGLSIKGCSHECFKDVLEPLCCPGYWGTECIECPENAQNPCNNNGVCSDGQSGNGTCACKAGFAGTACEDCSSSFYGLSCSSVCSCVHGVCSSGIHGDGQCTCFSGYKGLRCDQQLPECASLQCSQNARCSEDALTGQLQCRCLAGYQGNGVQCTSINPCLQNVCHSKAVCAHLGPNQHSCTCMAGYRGDGVVCMEVNPCQTDFGGCSAESAHCVYNGPGKSHCECLEGFENLTPSGACSLRDACIPGFCSANAVCTTTGPGTAQCACNKGFIGNGKLCYGNIMQRLQELNTEPNGQWVGQLSNAITLFESTMSWPLSSLGPFTVFIPINKGFKGTSVKALLDDPMNAQYLCKLHVVAGELSLEALKRGDVFYTLTGKSGEAVTTDEDQQIKIRIHGSRKKGDIVQSDVIASNGVIHLISKLMDSVPPTVQSEKEENLMKILSDNGKFNKFKSFLEMANVVSLLEGAGPYTLFAPTNTAMDAMNQADQDYLLSDQGKTKLLELVRNHVIQSVGMEVVNIVSAPRTVTMANQVLTFNVTSNGQILVNGAVILEADVQAKNGRLYSVDAVLVPASIEPILPRKCDVIKSNIIKGNCVRCSLVIKSSCPSGVSTDTFAKGCVFRDTSLGVVVPTLGCSLFCNQTVTTPLCCKSFYGPDCSPCPGGFTTPCSGQGQCMDGIEGNGTCICKDNFKGSHCQLCSNPSKYGPACDKTCPCIHGECDNRPDGDGSCKPGTCQDGYTGRFCERHTQTCGPRVEFCHSHAICDFNGGAVRCICKTGYQGDGITCVETDPCALPYRGGCSVNAKCIKTGPGSHTCQCLRGWRQDGDGCQAINNCLDSSSGGCHANATCIYIGPGQNDCECKNGFRGNGRECEPVNQCVQQNGGCHYMATCQYLSPGAWKCVCKEGYTGDGQVCYGTVVQELSAIPDGAEFYKWVNDAGISKMLSTTQDFTLLLPSTSAVQNMPKADRDFWTSRSSSLTTIIKCHMIQGVYQLADLRNSSVQQLTTFLKTSLPVSWNDVSTSIGGSAVTSSDIAATNGVIHIIDKVFIPDRKLSEGLLELLDQKPEYSLFRSALAKYNLTQEMEKSSAYTVFAPSDGAVRTYLSRTGSASLDVNTTRNHIVLAEKLMRSALRNGLYKDSMLGFSFQLGFFLRDGNLFVNEAQVNLTDLETSKGVIHGLTGVLEVILNRCDREEASFSSGFCLDCFTTKNPCPEGTKASSRMKNRCLLRRTLNGEQITLFGCRMVCKNSTIIRQCCGGFFGKHCENCPGPVGQPCFGNGKCEDGADGKGTCQCNPGFAGTACETCQPGKYSIHCDQDCRCAHGRCKEGPQGDGTCECDVGWRGVYCDTAVSQDACSGRCHSSANCIVQADGSSFCKCATGFEGNGTYCIGKDACALNNGGCSPKATCKRTGPGSRDCLCQAGHYGDGLVCVGINPCLVGNGGCHANAQCVHTGPNKTACVCNKGFSGDGNNCSAINPCRTRNGNCHRLALCNMTGPGERTCSCKPGYVGDGLSCKGTVEEEFFLSKNSSIREFVYYMARAKVQELSGLGPFTVFAPPGPLFSENWSQWRAKGVISDIMRYHVVSCRTLVPADLTKPRNLTTLQGEPLSITYSEDTIFINGNTKVVFSDSVSSNGIIHIIDAVLVPESVQAVLNNPQAPPTPGQQNLTDLAKVHGYATFTKLLEDTEVLNLVNDRIHQPVTLFWPTDRAMDALPQEQKDFLYSTQNRAQLQEYLKYHIVRDAMMFSSALVSASLKTLQGSDLTVKCAGDDDIGKLFLNNRKCQILQRQLPFRGGIAHGIDCLLTPPSLGGRCDTIDTLTVNSPCGRCNRPSRCPSGSKLKEKKKCDLAMAKMAGCQAVCTVVFWRSKCCGGFHGRDCLACPGGPKSVCSKHGKCDEGHFGTGNCTCDAGFQGVACELCDPGRYGPSCQACNCSEHGSCQEGRKGTGSCFCEQGWTGKRCESPLVVQPVCSPACSPDAVCKENNTCECKPFYEGDGLTCTLADLCAQLNGGCAAESRCTQKGVKVTCVCPRGHSGDGYVCLPIDPCAADDNGGCHEHATCSMTGPGKRKCECKTGYIGDGVNCDVRDLPINRCAQGNGQCHSDAQCTDLHFEDTKVGVFHVRSPLGQYRLNYTEAQEACRDRGGTMASYVQLSYAQEAGFNMCSAGWLEKERVAYPTTFSSPKCGFGHVGIVDYGPRVNLSETWDTFCYRMQDVQCTCKLGYIGDGYDCTGNLLQVLTATPGFSNFLSQILNYSRSSGPGREFLSRLSNITLQSTLFVPDNSGLDENKTLSERDIEYHLSESGVLYFQDLTNGTRIRTRLGHCLRVLGISDFRNASVLTASRYINDQFLIDWDILTSNGIIHVLQGPLLAPPKEPEFHAGHKAGLGMGLLLVVALLGVAAFGLYRFHGQRAKPFQFHYFKDEDGDPAEAPQPEDLKPSICNPVYDSSVSAPASPDPPAVPASPAYSATPAYPSYLGFSVSDIDGDTQGLVENDLLQDS